MTDDERSDVAQYLKEFRDTRLWAKYLLGGIAGAGIVGAVSALYRLGNGTLPIVVAGSVAIVTLVALAVTYFTVGKPVVLRQTAKGIELECGDQLQVIRYDELSGFRSRWTDVMRSGIYQHTQVRFAFSSQDPAAPVLTYDSTPDHGTLKYERLAQLQNEVTEIVAHRMADVMQNEGCVQWTEKLRLRSNGLELIKKAGAAPELVDFDRISQWKLDKGLFKLGVDGCRRPMLVEDTTQWNFYPGLLLFNELCETPSEDASVDMTEATLIG